MQRRSKNNMSAAHSDNPTGAQITPLPTLPQEHPPEEAPAQPKIMQTERRATSRNPSLLKMFDFNKSGIDSDALLIVAVILLLSQDNQDELLLFALIYLLM